METNFKVDVPSFALGYSAGRKKGGSGGGVELNIAYGDTPPEDTTKLWIKTEKPTEIVVTTDTEELIADGVMFNAYTRVTCVPLDGNIYILGGLYGSTTYRTAIYKYDTETKEYKSTAGRLEKGLATVAAGGYNGKIYMFGGLASGNSAQNTIQIYDTELDTVLLADRKFSDSFGIQECTAVTIGSKIYLFGGYGDFQYLNWVSCFDCETENFVPEKSNTSLPYKRSNWRGCAVGTKIYLFYTGEIICYDTEMDAPVTIPYISGIPTYGVPFEWDGEISFVGWYDGTHTYYDPESNTWRKKARQNSLTRYGSTKGMDGVARIGNKAYIIGGTDSIYYGQGYSYGVYRYTFPAETRNVPQGALKIICKPSNDSFRLLSAKGTEMNFSVKEVYRGNSDGIGELVECFRYTDGEWKLV